MKLLMPVKVPLAQVVSTAGPMPSCSSFGRMRKLPCSTARQLVAINLALCSNQLRHLLLEAIKCWIPCPAVLTNWQLCLTRCTHQQLVCSFYLDLGSSSWSSYQYWHCLADACYQYWHCLADACLQECVLRQGQYRGSRRQSGDAEQVTMADKQIHTGKHHKRASKLSSHPQTGTVQRSPSLRSMRPILGETTLNMLEVSMHHHRCAA